MFEFQLHIELFKSICFLHLSHPCQSSSSKPSLAMSATIDLQKILLFTISMPLISMIFYDCVFTLYAMYNKEKEPNILRDCLFVFAVTACIAVMSRTWLITATLLAEEDKSDATRITKIYYLANEVETKQASKEEKQTKTTKEAKEAKQDEADTPSKAPTTPPSVKESNGPNSDTQEEVHFQ